MKGLLKVVGASIASKKKYKPLIFNHPSTVYQFHKMGGFWCRLSQNQWARHFGIGKSTFGAYMNNGMSVQDVINHLDNRS